MTALEIMKKRRTVRFYTQEQIKEEELNLILEAGLWAPNAGSRQAQKFVVSQDRELNEKLGIINHDAIPNPVNNPRRTMESGNNTSRSSFYGAPTVIFIFTPDNYPNSVQDCCVAAENMILEATELGLGSAYIARGEVTFNSELGLAMKEKWGLSEIEHCHSIVLLGYPAKEFAPHARTEGRIIRA